AGGADLCGGPRQALPVRGLVRLKTRSDVQTFGSSAGDVVEVDSRGVSVNGGLLLRSAPLEQDAAGRPLTAVPAGVYSVPPGYVWMISSYSPRSFDSRYFGPLPVAQLRGRVQPLWLWRHD